MSNGATRAAGRPGRLVLAVVVLAVEAVGAFGLLLLMAMVINALGGGLAPIGALALGAGALAAAGLTGLLARTTRRALAIRA